MATSSGLQPVIRVATAGDVRALAWLRREWIREQAGEVDDDSREVDDPDFEQRLADWFATEVPLYRRAGFGPADMLLARPLPPGAA